MRKVIRSMTGVWQVDRYSPGADPGAKRDHR
jgi:hypothetical protein